MVRERSARPAPAQCTSPTAVRGSSATSAAGFVRLGGAVEGGTRQLDPESLGGHVARLYRAAYGLTGSRQDAEDLVQDTFERVLRRPRFLRRDEDVVYLLRVLRNTWISSGAAQAASRGDARRRGDRGDRGAERSDRAVDRGRGGVRGAPGVDPAAARGRRRGRRPRPVVPRGRAGARHEGGDDHEPATPRSRADRRALQRPDADFGAMRCDCSSTGAAASPSTTSGLVRAASTQVRPKRTSVTTDNPDEVENSRSGTPSKRTTRALLGSGTAFPENTV